MTIAKNTICLMFDKGAEEAAHFYAEIFPNSSVRALHRATAEHDLFIQMFHTDEF